MSPTILKSLESQTRRDLAATAKSHGIAGWHGMRKQELVKAIAKIKMAKSKPKRKTNSNGKKPTSPSSSSSPRPAAVPAYPSQSSSTQTPTEHQARIQKLLKSNGQCSHNEKMLPTSESVETKLTAQVKDSHWLLANWTITQSSLDRAKAALGAYWYQAVPVIRVYDITTNENSRTSKAYVKDVEVKIDSGLWYVQIDQPARSYKLQLGFVTPQNKFFGLVYSHKLTPPMPEVCDKSGKIKRRLDNNYSATRSRRYTSRTENGNGALTRLSLPLTLDPSGETNGSRTKQAKKKEFHVETELLIHGTSDPQAEVTLLGEKIPVSKEGRFALRLSLPNGRQVIPAVNTSSNKRRQQTIVLAIERNTKDLEPVQLDE
ncbi:hypothetical protein Enr10x_18100 [Gimesia panareensis]|uniref:Rho termination factor-like N-terminal domain-containing protein n=1 Tax=Gimesia panareensis TaxID=2527978 RepID=A0A517Q4D3_9PLAN|nr:DUF4912 domain-containing protein [Gimesia panareensis]QDT26506.1 hypothetical protein Enr10x_18100 [Gimesia panareensis]